MVQRPDLAAGPAEQFAASEGEQVEGRVVVLIRDVSAAIR
jgi:hypothetical protein